MQVGLFFGSFNPIHIGHLAIAQAAINQAGFNQVWFVVSPHNPHKQYVNLLPETERLRMVELATEGNDALVASNIEFLLPRPSYTVDTLAFLSDRYRSYRFSLIMGEDNLESLPRWKNPEAITRNYDIWVYERPGFTIAENQTFTRVKVFKAPQFDISATTIRTMLREKQSIRYLVHDKVREYIENNRLYLS